MLHPILLILLMVRIVLPYATQPVPPAPLKVFLLMGQSNMVGQGALPNPPDPLNRDVIVLGADNTWKVAQEPLGAESTWLKGEFKFGPGVAFGREYLSLNPGVRVGLVPCAVNGTFISEWKPGQPYYEKCVERARIAAQSGAISGVLWYQGESDALAAGAPDWADRFATVVAALRAEVGSVPVVYAQIGAHSNAPAYWVNWDRVMAQQAAVSLPDAAMVTTSDLPLIDGVHLSTAGQRVLAVRFAETMVALRRGVTPR